MAKRKLRGIQFDSPDEHEVFHAKESWIPVVLGIIPILLLGVAAFFIAWRFFNNSMVGLILLGVFAVVALATRVPRIFANLDTDVIVTDRRLYARTGGSSTTRTCASKPMPATRTSSCAALPMPTKCGRP